MPLVYFDANILKFSETKLRRFKPRQKIVTWGDMIITSEVNDIVYLNPNDSIKNNEKLKTEARLLGDIAQLAKDKRISLVIQSETLLESWGLPNLDSQSGKFYGAPYKLVEAPVKYGRVIVGDSDPIEDQFRFISSITNKRFVDLQKATGAYQGEKPLNRNQLLDAWHLWCAEYNKCDYFLTLDIKLNRVVTKSKSWPGEVKIVLPSELLESIKT